MEVDRSELMQVLTWLKPGIASKEFLEQSNHFILNEVEIISFNGDISIVCPFDIGVKCTVDASIFYKLLAKMDKETITVSQEDTTLVVECGDVLANLPTVIASEIFEYINKLGQEQDDLEWDPLPKDFLDAIRLCAFSASSDSTLGTATCVWVEGVDVLSTDTYRASWYKMDTSVKKNFYLEAAFISELLKYSEPLEVCLSDAWAHFALENGTVFSTRLVQPLDLLEVREKFEQFEHDVRIPLPAALSESIDTVSIAVEADEKLDQRVTIEFGKEVIRCTGSSIRGKIKRDINLNNPLEIDPFVIEASPSQLLEVVEKATHFLVGKKAGVFESETAVGYRHLMGILKK